MKVIALLKGGLGNQLFIYVAARQVVADLRARGVAARLHLDTSFFLFEPRYRMSCEVERLGLSYDRMSASWFGLVRQKLIRVWERYGGAGLPGWFGIHPEREPTEFTPILRDGLRGGSLVISGYRQNVAYFDGRSAIAAIRAELDAGGSAQGLPDASDVCVHLRVLYSPSGNVFNPERWSPEVRRYYVTAATSLEEERPGGTFRIYGDHADTQEDLAGELRTRGLRAEVCRSEFQDDAVADFRAMRGFRRFVIGDSTFAWWSAYLASRLEVVLLPAAVYSKRPGQVFASCRLV